MLALALKFDPPFDSTLERMVFVVELGGMLYDFFHHLL